MYTLAQSGAPQRRTIAAGRYGEAEDPPEEIDHGIATRRVSPPPPRAIDKRAVEKNRQESSGDLQPITTTIARNGKPDEGERSPSLSRHRRRPHEPSSASQLEQEENHLREQQQIHLRQQLDGMMNFSPAHFETLADGSSPPQYLVCRISRTSSLVSEISINEREWIFDDSTSGSSNSDESDSVKKHMVSAEDWEGIVLAASRPEHERHQHQSRPLSSLSKIRPSEVSSGGPQLILDNSFHTPLSPPQRKPSLPSNSHIRSNSDNREIDLRDFTPEFGPNDAQLIPNKPSAWKPVEENAPSTASSTPSSSLHQQPVHRMEPVNEHDLSDRHQSFSEIKEQDTILRREELQIEGMSEEEMLQMALQASKQDFEEREQILAALQDEDGTGSDGTEEQLLNDAAIAYSLEALLAQPAPQRPPVPNGDVSNRKGRSIQNFLMGRRGRKTSPPTS